MNLNNNILRKAEIKAKIRRIASITANVIRKASINCNIDLELIAPPKVVSATISFEDANYQIGILFDRALANIEPNSFDFAVTLSGGAVSVDTVAVEGLYCYLILNREVLQGETGKVTYTQSTPKLQSAEGFIVANFTQALINSIESSSPVLQSITVEDANPTKIIHTYDLDLDETSVPDISDFAFSTKTGTGTVVVSGKTVTCTVTARYYWGDSGGTSAYTKGSTPIKSTAGGEADSFTATAITNNCALDAATTTLVAEGRYTNAPSDALKALINKTLIDYKAAGLFAKRDVLWLRPVHEALLACQNWIKDAHNSTLVNSPTFTPKVGFTGDGLTSYINDNYKPFSQASTFAMDAACISFMDSAIGNANNKYSFGIAKATAPAFYCLFNFRTAANEQFYFNSAGTLNDNVNQTNGDYMSYTRTGTSTQGYKNGSPSGAADTVAASSALADWNFYELAGNSNGTLPAAHYNGTRNWLAIGGFLTAEEVAAEYTIIKYFFDNVGGTF